MHEQYGDDVEVLSIAVDAQGAEKARPFVEKAGARFTTLVDERNLLGRTYGFKAIPNGYLIDESGVVRYKRLGGFDVRRQDTASVVERWCAGQDLDENAGHAAEHDSENDEVHALFQSGQELYRQGKVAEAVEQWREAAALEPANWIVRKQLWAVEHPERFYDGAVDFDWQKEQIAREA